jgi:medium-chain acyl-[acyl-carrier-protein] hydrolase
MSNVTTPWFVCPRPNPKADTRLFIFPYAGGGPAAFHKWAAELPVNVEMWIAHYPGRGSRHNEPPITELDIVVEKLSQAIQPLLDKPFAFFGHSLGGLVAFELARSLRQRNLSQPDILFVSACGAPHLPDLHPPIHALPDAEFLNAVREINGIPPEFLNYPEMLDLLLPVLRADFQAFETYRYAAIEPPLDIPITAYGGLDDPHVSRERLEGWATQTNSVFKSIYFPGGHFFINTTKDKLVRSIAAEMMPSIIGSRKPA